MITKIKYFLTAATLIALSSCAYPTKKGAYIAEPPTQKMAVVYIYRTQTSIHGGNPDVPVFYVNEGRVGKLSIGGYYRVLVNPGEISVTNKGSLFGIPTPWKEGEVKFTAKENMSYYVKYAVEMNPFLTTTFKLVPNSFGENDIKTTKLLVN